jgi:hypothetical protein
MIDACAAGQQDTGFSQNDIAALIEAGILGEVTTINSDDVFKPGMCEITVVPQGNLRPK